MKKFDIKAMAEKQNSEYVFGAADTGSHACYMIYGTLKPGEKGREIKPGKGHEEMLLSARGSFSVTGAFEGIIEEGSAIHLSGEQTCYLENKGTSEAVYVIAGGHSEHGHDH
ncbi:MAG: hypothetical protein Q8K68_06025 [Nitrospirota bacterium]|nr:hypothetical protein [Nitrospirota bacterium]